MFFTGFTHVVVIGFCLFEKHEISPVGNHLRLHTNRNSGFGSEAWTNRVDFRVVDSTVHVTFFPSALCYANTIMLNLPAFFRKINIYLKFENLIQLVRNKSYFLKLRFIRKNRYICRYLITIIVFFLCKFRSYIVKCKFINIVLNSIKF